MVGDEARAAARGGLALVVLQAVGKMLGFVFVLSATRQVTPAAFGRYAIVASLLLFANFLADSGTTAAVVRLVAREPESSHRVLTGSALASIALGVGSGVALFGFVLAADYPRATEIDAAIAFAGVPAQSLLGSVLGAFDGRGAITTRSWLSLAQTAVVALGGAGALVVTADVRTAVIALGAAPWVVLALSVAMSRRRGYWRGAVGFDEEIVKRVFRLALPFAMAGAMVALSLRFDVVLLSLLRSRDETAVYELTLRAIEGIAIIGTAAASSTTFLLNRRIAAGELDAARAAYREMAVVLYIVGLLVSAVMLSLARPIATLAFGTEYEDVALPLAVIGGVQWLAFIVQLEGALVNSRDDLTRSTAVAALCLSSTIALDIVLVPQFGLAGATGASAAGIALTAIGLNAYHRRTLGFSLPFPPLGALLAFAVACAVGVFAELPLAVELPLVSLAYLAVTVATRVVDRALVTRTVSLVLRPV